MCLPRPAKEPHSTPRPILDNHLTFWLAIVRAKDVWAIGIPWDFSEVNIPICTNITLRHQLNEEKTVYVSMMGGGGKSAMKEGWNHWIPSPPQWSSQTDLYDPWLQSSSRSAFHLGEGRTPTFKWVWQPSAKTYCFRFYCCILLHHHNTKNMCTEANLFSITPSLLRLLR